MAVYFVNSYDITHPELYAKYNPGSMQVILEVLAETGCTPIAGGPVGDVGMGTTDVGIVAKFPDRAALMAFLDHPRYAEARAIREASTTNYRAFVLDEFPQG